MAAYITRAEIEAQITAAKLDALFADDVGDAHLNELIERASGRVRSAALRAYGRDVLGDSTTTNEQAKAATMAVFLLMAYGRRDLSLPERYMPDLALVDALESGRMALVGVTPDTEAAIGGVAFSALDESEDDDARYNPFRRDKMRGY